VCELCIANCSISRFEICRNHVVCVSIQELCFSVSVAQWLIMLITVFVPESYFLVEST